MKAYKEILIARESNQDTAQANREVRKIFKKYNYTEKSFRDKYFEMASNREEFVNLIDSVRKSVTKEIGDKSYKEELAEMMPADSTFIKKDSTKKGKIIKSRKRIEPSK
jgi:hypothetical protein